ncbi:methyl-CpG-binding domain-containing protein 4-like [Bidens hawaiensis]|uniref:methyl-CpG-binding domain-containing protein 4-like n=1 Tax=Bidens hawaiensis TaxID=980011 RepID=UPI004048F240
MMEKGGSANNSPETPKAAPASASSSTLKTSTSEIVAFAVQCNTCYQWRKLATEEHFEEFRCTQTADPFVCNKLPGTTCEKPADISVDSSHVWVMDKPNMSKTPKGFKRICTLRSDYTKMDVQYMTPQGNKIRTTPGMVDYLKEHPECSHLSPSDFCFAAPKIMRDTVPKYVVKNPISSTKKKQKVKK